MIRRLALVLMLILALCCPAAASADGGETVFFYEDEDAAVYDVTAQQFLAQLNERAMFILMETE